MTEPTHEQIVAGAAAIANARGMRRGVPIIVKDPVRDRKARAHARCRPAPRRRDYSGLLRRWFRDGFSYMPCSNAFPELVDLDARRGNASNEGMALNADLRVGLGEIPVEGGDVLSVGVRLLRIDLSVDGLRIRPGPRYGEPVQPNEVRTSSRIVTDEAEHVGTMGKLAGGAKADFSGKPAVATNLAARASVLRERKSGHTKHVETTDESVFLRVRALPGQRWRVQEPDNRALEATFLTDNELCQLEPVPQANRHSAGLEVSFSPKDVVVDAPRGWFAGSQAKTKEKIIKAIIARGLNSGSAHASGRIKISEVEVDDAG